MSDDLTFLTQSVLANVTVPNMRVPNEFPISLEHCKKVALIGEAPGADEHLHKRPFVGASGQLLDSVLRSIGYARGQFFLGNICQIHPPGNDLSKFDWNGPQIQTGLGQLKEDLDKFDPDICVLMGNWPLFSATLDKSAKISDWQCTLFRCNNGSSPFYNRKCIAAYHPAYVLRAYENRVWLNTAIKRAVGECGKKNLELPNRNIYLNYNADEIVHRLQAILDQKHTISVDIEGYITNVTCISVATSPQDVFIIPFNEGTLDDQCRIISKLSEVLYSLDVPKILQNSLYDNFVLTWLWKMPIRNVIDDTMLKSWEIYAELPKDLGSQTALWTREPFYKSDFKKQDRDTFFRYCCKDSAVTYEISNYQERVLSKLPAAYSHYRFHVELLNACMYMELRGFNYDKLGARLEADVQQGQRNGLQDQLDRLSLRHVNVNCNAGVNSIAKFLYEHRGLPKQVQKKNGKLTTTVTADKKALLKLYRLTQADSDKHPTAEKPKNDNLIVRSILKLRSYDSVLETLNITTDKKDDRVRCSYNIVGTDTGRFSCSTSITGSGANLQTVMKKLRKYYIADPGKYLFQCDLSGADGWTVAARCADCGDPTMLEDYQFGLKPAKILALMYERGESVGSLTRDDLKDLCLMIDQDGWLYYGCKRVQHGTNYDMSQNTMSDQILTDSYKETGEPIYVSPNQCAKLQILYKTKRYNGITKWHDWVIDQVTRTSRLRSASGHERIFLGRKMSMGKFDFELKRQALAEEPQNNTTYATSKALHNLWTDSQNRLGSYFGTGSFDNLDLAYRMGGLCAVQHIIGNYPQLCANELLADSLLIEPIHQVHDAMLGQFDVALSDWAAKRIVTYFNNPLQIGKRELVIPFEGHYGPSWGEQTFTIG